MREVDQPVFFDDRVVRLCSWGVRAPPPVVRSALPRYPHWVDELRPLTARRQESAPILEQRGVGSTMDRVEALLIDWIPPLLAAGKIF